jgi:hypothetical protein
VLDDEVRRLVEVVRDQAAKVAFAPNMKAADDALPTVMAAFDHVNERIGELIRKIDDSD